MEKHRGKKIAVGLTIAAALIAGVAVGIKVGGSLDFSGEEYRLKKTPLVENYEAGSDEETSLFRGIVVDEEGEPVEGAWVAVGIKGEKKPFVKMETDEKGGYSWKVEDEKERYYLVFQKEDYITVVMEPGEDGEKPYNLQGEVVLLYKEEEKEAVYPVSVKGLAVCAEEMGEKQELVLEEDRWDVEDEPDLAALDGAEVEIRSGINCMDGEPQEILKTGDDGIAAAELKKGVYTAVIKKEGFNPAAFVVYARENQPEITIPCVEQSSAGWQILLTWEEKGESLLDLDSFAIQGNRLINSLNRGDEGNGRYLYDSYGKTGCEVIELPGDVKDYQYYVMDYNSVLEGGVSRLKDSNAAVWVYQNGTLTEHFELPEKKKQPVWNPFAVKDGRLVTVQKGLDVIEGADGWREDKVLARMNSKNLNTGKMLSDGEWIYFSNYSDNGKLYYIKKDGTGLTKICDDQMYIYGNKALSGDWIYYCPGNEAGWGEAVYRITTDGSRRELVKEMDGTARLEILGAADGKLFIWNRNDIGGEILYIDENGQENSLGTGLGKDINLVGSSVYYLNEAGYNGTDKGLHCRNLKTGEDALVIPDVDWFQFYIHDGYVYYDEGISLFRMQLGKEPEFITSASESVIGSFIIYEDWIYYYDDGSVYRTNLDGSDKKIVKISAGWYDIIDGELYTDWGKYDPIRISDLNGENERILFDALPYKQEAAAQAYYEYLCNNETNNDPEWPSHSSFASLDINGDGINELFYSVSEYSMNTDKVYSFGNDMVLAKDLADGYKYGGTIVYDESAKRLAAMYRYGEMGSPDEVTLYSTESLYPQILDSGYRYSSGWEDDAPDVREQAERFDAILAGHWFGKPSIEWVENTEENRVTYILNGVSTGYGDLMEAE